MLSQSCAGFGMLALQGLLASEMQASAVNPLAAKKPHFAPRAKRVIFLLMKGGPSQVDTFDPKSILKRDQGKLSEIKSTLSNIANDLQQVKEYRSVKIVFDVDPV